MLVILGGIGFPVIGELARDWRRPRTWSLHTKLVVLTTVALLVLGTLVVCAFEWSNPETLGRFLIGDRVLNGWFQSVVPRTAGFNSVPYSDMNPPTILVTIALMFIGGGSAGTAGGIKITTFVLLAFVIWSELRGEPDVNAFRRRVPAAAQRQALAIALIGVAVVMVGTIALLALADFSVEQSLFEAVSAFATVGLSMGITPELPGSARVVLIVMMFIGRVGPVTMFAALTLRERDRLYRYAEERPIIG
jgi:Trk-type K+ transport system membrane component